MRREHADALWLDPNYEISFAELTQSSGASEAEVRELVEHGALIPTDPHSAQWTFTGNCVITVRTARRLRCDFDLDPHALALALAYVARIRELENELNALRALLPGRQS